MNLAVKQLTPGLLSDIFNAIDSCKQQPEYGVLFSEPVDYLGPPLLENYLIIAPRPMDYSTIQQGIN